MFLQSNMDTRPGDFLQKPESPQFFFKRGHARGSMPEDMGGNRRMRSFIAICEWPYGLSGEFYFSCSWEPLRNFPQYEFGQPCN